MVSQLGRWKLRINYPWEGFVYTSKFYCAVFVATGYECSSVIAQEVLKRTHKLYCFLIASILCLCIYTCIYRGNKSFTTRIIQLWHFFVPNNHLTSEIRVIGTMMLLIKEGNTFRLRPIFLPNITVCHDVTSSEMSPIVTMPLLCRRLVTEKNVSSQNFVS